MEFRTLKFIYRITIPVRVCPHPCDKVCFKSYINRFCSFQICFEFASRYTSLVSLQTTLKLNFFEHGLNELSSLCQYRNLT